MDAITKRRPDVDRKDAANLWTGFKTAWAVNGLMNLDAYKKSCDFFYQAGMLEKVPKNRSLRNGRILDSSTAC